MKKLINKSNIVVGFIFLLAFILRFWQVPQHFIFGIDEEYQSLLALTIVKDFHLIWIGLSAANTGFYVGPGLVYIHALLLWLNKLDPVILGYAASLTGLITTIVLYFIIKKFFNSKVAIISTILFSCSAFIVSYDRRFWNPSLVPLIALLFFVSFILSKKNVYWYILTATLLAVSFHIHASLFIFIPITLTIILYRLIKQKQKIPIKAILLSLFSFIVIYSPLIVFDFVHNFDNLKTPFRMFQQIEKGSGGFSYLNHFQIISSTLSHFLITQSPNTIISLLLYSWTIVLLLLFIFKKKSEIEKVIAIIIGWYFVMFIFYPGIILDYYFLGFLPFLIIIMGIFLQQFNKKLLVILLILFMIPNIHNTFNLPTESGLATKKNVILKTIRETGNKTFYLDTTQEYINFGGWRYLFEAYGKKPSSSQADSMFGWIYQKDLSSDKPQLKVIISENNIKPKEPIQGIITEYPYTVYVVNNN